MQENGSKFKTYCVVFIPYLVAGSRLAEVRPAGDFLRMGIYLSSHLCFFAVLGHIKVTQDQGQVKQVRDYITNLVGTDVAVFVLGAHHATLVSVRA